LSALVLDAGAFVAVDRGDRAMMVPLRIAQQRGIELRTSAIAVAQVRRDSAGRQTRLARLLRSTNIIPVDLSLAREAAVLPGCAGLSDAVDATVALIANHGDRILTSNPPDLRCLVAAANCTATVTRC